MSFKPIIIAAAAVAAASAQGQELCSGRAPVANTLIGQPACTVPAQCSATYSTAARDLSSYNEDADVDEDSDVCIRAPSCDEIKAASGPVYVDLQGYVGIGRKGGKFCTADNADNVERRQGFPFTAVKIPNSNAKYFHKNPNAKRYQSFCVTKEAEDGAPAVVKRIKNTRVKDDDVNLFAAISERAGCPGQNNGAFNPYDEPCGNTYALDAVRVFAKTLGGSLETKTMDVDGLEREYYVYTPQSVIQKRNEDPTHKERTVIELHGLTSCAEYNALYTGWFSLANSEGFVLVLPVGTQLPGVNLITQEFEERISSWNAGFLPFVATVAGIDDSKFIRNIVQDVTAEIADPTRVYIAGHSNGAAMAQRMAYESPELFAAVATHSLYLTSPNDPNLPAPASVFDPALALPASSPVLGGLQQGFANFGIPARIFTPGNQIPAFHVHGDADLTVPYSACASAADGCIPSPGAIGNNFLWALLNTCGSIFTNPSGAIEAVGGDEGSFVLTHSQCGAINQGVSSFVGDKEIEVKLLTVGGGSHRPFLNAADSTGDLETLDTTKRAWDFIKGYQRKA